MTNSQIPKNDMFSLNKSCLIKDKLDNEVYLEVNNKLISTSIPQNFNTEKINLPSENYGHKLREIAGKFGTEVEKFGYNMNIYTALYEAILNAHQHGNKLDSKKEILLGSSINKENLEFIIADQGNILNQYFTRFILNLREKDISKKFINWYDFSNQKKSDANNGTGTNFMTMYMDEVKYFKSDELGGLAVYLRKEKKK